jgi:hypothetical protein
VTNDKRVEEIRKTLDKAYSNARRHEHWHGRIGKTSGELMTEFYGDATSDLAFLLSELDRAKTALRAARARLVFIEKHSCENPPRCGYESSKTVALINEVLDAPTENKSNER